MTVSDWSEGWAAPAKLNLFLHITGRRADGLHELQTVFQFIDRCDELAFRVREDGVVQRVSDLAGVDADSDLVVRAARCLQAAAGCGLGAEIRVHKRLPVGAGLGGGSSDAATTLVALNHLWGLDFSRQRLAELGLTLGADVPVFVHGEAAWAEGVGERLTPVQLKEPWYVVIAPPCSVSTAAIFAAPDLTRDCRPITIRDFLRGQGINVCESVVCSRYPEVANALKWLARFAPARMTGTGGCVFAAFDEEKRAREAAAQLPSGWNGFVARGMNRSPLLEGLRTKD